jgi:hypothetical protein
MILPTWLSIQYLLLFSLKFLHYNFIKKEKVRGIGSVKDIIGNIFSQKRLASTYISWARSNMPESQKQVETQKLHASIIKSVITLRALDS